MRGDTFAFKINADERRMITELALRLNRTKSDAVRVVIREAVRVLESENTPPAQPAQLGQSSKQAVQQ